MKIMVKLGVLLATLLLLTGLAFASSTCDCYEVTVTLLDDPEAKPPKPYFIRICFNYENNVGTIFGLCSACESDDPLYMFFDQTFLSNKALTYHSNAGVCMAYLKFHGSHNNVLTGLITGEGRATLWGHKTEEQNCRCR